MTIFEPNIQFTVLPGHENMVEVRAKRRSIRASRVCQWWKSDRRKRWVLMNVHRYQRAYRKASGGYLFTPKTRLHGDVAIVEIESQWHPVHQWLTVKQLSVPLSIIINGKLIERIKDEWAQERRALEEFNRLPYSILGAAHGV